MSKAWLWLSGALVAASIALPAGTRAAPDGGQRDAGAHSVAKDKAPQAEGSSDAPAAPQDGWPAATAIAIMAVAWTVRGGWEAWASSKVELGKQAATLRRDNIKAFTDTANCLLNKVSGQHISADLSEELVRLSAEIRLSLANERSNPSS